MGSGVVYVLEAVIGRSDVIRTVADDLPGAVFIPLSQDIAMVPMTDALIASAGPEVTADLALGFLKLPAGFEHKLSGWSSRGPVGYVEAEFFGGVGTQQAALWTAGRLSLGPISVDEGQPGSPISELLRHLGVDRGDHYDEFEAVGLDRHRWTDEWQQD